jgi:hypothetical protein
VPGPWQLYLRVRAGQRCGETYIRIVFLLSVVSTFEEQDRTLYRCWFKNSAGEPGHRGGEQAT